MWTPKSKYCEPTKTRPINKFELSNSSVRIGIDSPPGWRRHRPANEGRGREGLPAPPAIPIRGPIPAGSGGALIIKVVSVVTALVVLGPALR